MESDEKRINCNIFQKQEPIIKRLTDSINTAKEFRGKIPHAERLFKEVNNLLDCPDYKEKETDCSNCHFIADLRRRTAEIIIKAKKLK